MGLGLRLAQVADMISSVLVTIPGPPLAQPRHRVGIWANKSGSKHGVAYYQPQHAKEWRKQAQHHFKREMKGHAPFSGPIKVTVWYVLERTQTSRGRKLKPGRQPKSTRPDIDNYEKALLDAGNGVLWRDDGQIWYVCQRKLFAAENEVPHVVMFVEESTYDE